MGRGCHVLRSVAFLLLLLFVLQLLQDVQDVLVLCMGTCFLLWVCWWRRACRRGKEKSLHQGGLQFGRGSGLLPRSHPPATPLAGSEPFCITLYHPQAHLEQSALLLLFYDFFGSHRSPLGSANKSKNQLLYLSCVLSNFIHPSWTFILLQLQIFTLHSFLELQRWYAYGWTRKR